MIDHAVCHAVVWPPPYDGPRPYGKPMVPEIFHEQVVAPGGNAGAWMVLFTDAMRHDGIAMAPLFAELAGTFGQGRLRFGEVDVATWPELADHYKACFPALLHKPESHSSGLNLRQRKDVDSNLLRDMVSIFRKPLVSACVAHKRRQKSSLGCKEQMAAPAACESRCQVPCVQLCVGRPHNSFHQPAFN
jgi:hypothetical protein